MQFLDIQGVRSLWQAILDARTVINAPEGLLNVAETHDSKGRFTYTLTLSNTIAEKSEIEAAKEALYGGSVPAENALTLSNLDSRIDDLESGSVVTVEKQATAEESFAATYVVKQNGAQVGVKINIPKDFLVRSAELKVADATDNIDGVATGEKYIDFVINTPGDDDTAKHVYLPINDLVDTYTGEKGVAIDAATNKVSGVVDPTSESFFTVGANGFKLAGVHDAIDSAKSAVIGASTDAASADTINGAKKYADDAVAAVAGNYATKAQGEKADSALQSVSKGTDGDYVTTTIGAKANNDQAISVAVKTANVSTSGTNDGLAVASDVKSYVDSAVAAKNVDAEGDSYVSASASDNKVTVAASASTIASLGKADSAIQGVQVNSADLTPDANKKVNISIAEGSTAGTVSVNGSDVAVHGLGSMAYANTGDYATSAQGAAADSALQSISNGADGDYIDVTVTPKGNGTTQEVSATVTVQPIASSSDSAKGLVEASDAKAYIDGKFTNLGEITKTASGTAQNGGVFVVNKVVEENGALKSVGSLEVEQAGAAAAAESRLRGATDADGYVANDTLAALRNDINSITGGSGSIATQIQNAVNALDSSVASTGTTSGDNIAATQSAVDAESQTAQYFLTGATITDGKFSAGTSTKIEGIPTATLSSIFVTTPSPSGD